MSKEISIPHLCQTSYWDCGVTCVRMVLSYYKIDLNLFDALLSEYNCNKSTWSIDLLNMLSYLHVRSKLSTITLGCSDNYASVPYYKNIIDKDRQRVEELFSNQKLNFEKCSLEWSNIKLELDQNKPFIVLIDANKLSCICCTSIVGRLISKVWSSSYQGHYIVVVGYQIDEKQTEYVLYKDPGSTECLCKTTIENFDRARKAFGTDEDIIICEGLESDK
ncbi:unnamed protein product [Didymodactylos carnosus]|uniref:Guanylyl cyclase n=1 Tax=Didymodactylos carnosus TaxID=1234261 RepID=A0A814LT52_9BILA|nr:unnamed protein product [Didymodactylos carnosus]CAF1406842.1 unnamed protein product [Didymodactylos carnosus]CAF3836710.1 unnamed protein product [Didymodactylos carnosus]CAF4212128.1 unnamed protein product [Didymodactylos carnosus]